MNFADPKEEDKVIRLDWREPEVTYGFPGESSVLNPRGDGVVIMPNSGDMLQNETLMGFVARGLKVRGKTSRFSAEKCP